MAVTLLSKGGLLAELSTTTGAPKKQVALFLDTLLAIAYGETKKKGAFVLPGIGKLEKVKRKARKGVNPKTGEPIKIAAATVVKIRPVKAAKDAIVGAKAGAVASKAKTVAAKDGWEAGEVNDVREGWTTEGDWRYLRQR